MALTVLAMSGPAVSVGLAQQSPKTASGSGPATLSAGERPQTAAAFDTIIQPGHRDVAPYDTPGRCLALSAAVEQRVTRPTGLVPDTSAYAPDRRSVPAAAVEAARRCGARFTAAMPLAPVELWNLFDLSLTTGDDARAAQAAERWLATRGAAARRAWSALDVMDRYLKARPQRMTAAVAVAARLDTMPGAPADVRYIAHRMLLDDAVPRFDTTMIEREALAQLAAQAKLSPEQRATLGTQDAGGDFARSGWGPFFALMYNAVDRAPRAPKAEWAKTLAAIAHTGYTMTPMDQQIAAWLGAAMEVPLPPVPAAHWYGAQGAPRWPVPGRVSLLFQGITPGVGQYNFYAMLRRLHEQYGDALNVTVIGKTQGVWAGAPLPGAAEADSIAAYYLDFLKLPITVAVDETPFTTFPDGRVDPQPAAFEKYQIPGAALPGFPMFLLADQQGKSVMVSPFLWPPEATLDAIIKKLLGR